MPNQEDPRLEKHTLTTSPALKAPDRRSPGRNQVANSASCNVKLDKKESVGCCKHTNQVATPIPGKRMVECSITGAKWFKSGEIMRNAVKWCKLYKWCKLCKAVDQKWDVKIQQVIEKSWQQGFSRAAPCSYSVASNPDGQMASKFKQHMMIEANWSFKFNCHPRTRNVSVHKLSNG
jgi:hypothetical protein